MIHNSAKNSNFNEDQADETKLAAGSMNVKKTTFPNTHKGGVNQYYFQPQPNVDSSHLKMTPISLYSTTPWKEANFISRAIINFYTGGSLPTITDGTANVGGNTISFYLNGIQTVNAVEIDPSTCELLKNNLATYQLPTKNVYCSDYLDIYLDLKQDVVFLDPPWGGRDYKKAAILDLYLGQTNIIDICVELMTHKRASLIVLKLPINYNLPALIKKMPNKSFVTQKIYRCCYKNGVKLPNRHSYNVVFCF